MKYQAIDSLKNFIKKENETKEKILFSLQEKTQSSRVLIILLDFLYKSIKEFNHDMQNV